MSPSLACEDRQQANEAAYDAEAFTELYCRYYVRLVHLCERRLGDPHRAEDVAQEALLRAMRYIGGYDATRPVWPWLRKIALRIAHQDAQKAAAELRSDLRPELLDAPARESVDDVDQWVVLRAALRAVPARQRTALVVRYIDDWSTADAAELHGLGVGAFEQLLWRARRRLSREYLRIAS